MNIYKAIRENIFFNKFISQNMLNEVLIGNIEIYWNSIVIHIHTNCKPAIEISKYGVWGENYNTISIELFAIIKGEIKIKNREFMTYAPVEVQKTLEGYLIKQEGDNWSISFEIIGDFLFRRISSTYIQ